MKTIENELIEELRIGSCAPAITKLAKKLRKPGSTIHFNIKKMEKEGKILSYKAVFDNEKIGQGFIAFALVKLSSSVYSEEALTSRIAKRIAKYPEVESVDVLTGEYELIVKLRAKDQKEYFALARKCIAGEGIAKVNSLISLGQFKSEYVERR
jgi:DNA-binding Lrp family transcriptional regulator